jgi:hypothetical protein
MQRAAEQKIEKIFVRFGRRRAPKRLEQIIAM